jgi:RND family efflux transporter MFP subunit
MTLMLREKRTMRTRVKPIVLSAIVVVVIIFITSTLRRAAPPKNPAEPPDLSRSVARVYGEVEPQGGNVYVAPMVTRPVIEIHVNEGDTVEAGQKICTLENSVEKAQVRAAVSRVASSGKTYELSRDAYKRNRAIYGSKGISEFEFVQSRLRAEIDSLNLIAAKADAELAQAQLEQTVLQSPIDGIVYKMDLRLGESIAAGDNTRIIVGERGFWVRLYVESFWAERVEAGARYTIKDAETYEIVGEGTVISIAPYLDSKVFTTDDIYERFDTKYQEVIVQLQPEVNDIPIGLSVLAEIQPIR